MRITLFTALIASVVAAGCNRADATPGSAAAAPAAAEWREITIPAGTQLAITLDTAVGSDTSAVEQPVAAHVTRSIHVQGQTVVEAGSRVSGVVTDAARSAKVKGRAHVAMRFDALTTAGGNERYTISTALVERTAGATKEKDALEIAGPAAGGAIIGALLGGKKGAAIGAGVGGGAGTAVVLSTRGTEVHLQPGAPLTLSLTAPLTIRVRG